MLPDSQLYEAAAVDSVEAVASVAVLVAAGAAHAEESLVLKVAPQLKGSKFEGFIKVTHCS